MKTEATSVCSVDPATRTIEPISPRARANARTEPERIPGQDVRQTIRRKTVTGPRRASERLLHLHVELDQHRLHRPDDERERDEAEGEHDRRSREGESIPTGEPGP
jgi:hypothetical protein